MVVSQATFDPGKIHGFHRSENAKVTRVELYALGKLVIGTHKNVDFGKYVILYVCYMYLCMLYVSMSHAHQISTNHKL